MQIRKALTPRLLCTAALALALAITPMAANAAEPGDASDEAPGLAPAPRLERGDVSPDWMPRLGPIGFAGALTTVAGAAALGGGLVLHLLPPPGFQQARRAGVGVIAAGATFTALGVTGVLVDVFVLQRRQRSRVQVSSGASRYGFGLTVSGSF